MEAPEADRRVEEFSTLVECERRRIEQLERGGNDVTSAKIIFDSLRVSLALHIHNRHRVFCNEQPEMALTNAQALAPSSADNSEPVQPLIWINVAACIFDIVRTIALRGGVSLKPTKSDSLKAISPLDIDGINQHLDKAPVVPDDNVQEKTDDQLRSFGFRPLTEEEKNEFVNSLDAKSEKMLAALVGKESPSEPAAANQNLKSAKLSAGRV